MKSFTFFAIALAGVFSLNAQDEKKSEIRVTIEKDGKSVKDTVYMVEEGRSVEHASKILDMTFGEMKHGEKHKVMTFTSDDGELHEFHSGDKEMMKIHKMHSDHAKMGEKGDIHKMHSGNVEMGEEHEMMMKMIHESDDDTQVFVTTEEGEDGETKVMVKKIKMGKDGDMHKMMSKEGMNEEEHEMIMKMIHDSDDDTQVFVTTEEGEDGETKVIVKKIKKGKDGDHSMTNKEENVFIMKAGEKGEMKQFKHNGEEPVWIEKDGAKVLIIDSEDGMKKKIMVITDSESDHEFKTENGETIIIRSSKNGDNEKNIKVEVIVENENPKAKKVKKKVKKTKK